ncbi:hypothetical protein [Pontibacter anaerobius]|uniref:DUF389 domain-containing protein n=1 Tax=Pontibacter anaerobius TaxID=2993940 RepID=A0ABT3RHL6_9BACT|nr:hypothetical protein [Pontibacter anaerobius]MCX2740857.1 hypothetical protein [Pontibacter anaerobius]
MHVITVKAPEGQGENIAAVAFRSGVSQVSVQQARQQSPDRAARMLDVVEIEAATPKTKKFIEDLMAAPYFDPQTFSFSILKSESQFASESPGKETHPIARPSTDVYEELWQFVKVTVSLAGRVFLSSVLLAYGMVENMLPLIIAGLLFLPYHHHMLAVGLGACLKEWRFFRQGILALCVSTLLIFLAGACVAFFTEPPIGFQELGTPLSGFILAMVIGVAAALGAMVDAGRRELIGLAATAHISIFPVWFGLKAVFGFAASDKVWEHLVTFGANITSLTVAAAITFAVIGMRGDGIRRFIKGVSKARL